MSTNIKVWGVPDGPTEGGSGDVVGPSSATDNAFARFDATTGKLLQNSVVTCSDTGAVTGIDDLTLAGSIMMDALETVDGRDVSVDGSTLDTLVINAVTAAAPFATDELLLRSDGTGKGAQASTIAVTDAGAVSGITSLSASGAITGSNLSGTNTGDQTITLTGNVTGSGTGSFAATIANNAVTYAQMQDTSAPSVLLGRGDSGAGDPQEIALGANLTMAGATLAASVPATTFGTAQPSGGADGDTYFQIGLDIRWVKIGGTWTRQWSDIQAQLGPTAQACVGGVSRYNSTTTNVFGGAALTSYGTTAGEAYATTNVMTTRTRVSLTPTATANQASSGFGSASFGAVVVDSSTLAGKHLYTADFGFTSVTQTNFRFFSGYVSAIPAANFGADPTTASMGLSDRIGLAIDANTSLAGRWLVNHTAVNLQNDAAVTLAADRWYRHHIYNRGGVIYQELWEWTSAASYPTLVASTTHTPSATVWANARTICAVANAGTAAAAGTLHFGQMWVSTWL